MRFAVFFRNLNFGHAGSPTKAQFLQALEAGGARAAASILSHGTAVFSADSDEHAQSVVAATCGQLQTLCGWLDAAHVRCVADLARLVASEPFASGPQDEIYERCVTFLPAKAGHTLTMPIISPRRDIEVFAALPDIALGVVRLVNGRPGNINALLERLTAARLTTRNWNTVSRVVRQEAAAGYC